MRLVQVRDIRGVILSIHENPKKSMQRIGIAAYVRCPETDHLKSLRQCRQCPLHSGMPKDKGGVKCESDKDYRLRFNDRERAVTYITITKKKILQ